MRSTKPAPAEAGVMKTAESMIDLGPEGGVMGGEMETVGVPETVTQTPGSFTGRYLQSLLRSTTANEPAQSEAA